MAITKFCAINMTFLSFILLLYLHKILVLKKQCDVNAYATQA